MIVSLSELCCGLSLHGLLQLVDHAGDSSHGDETHIEWQYNGQPCKGIYQPATGVLVLSFHLKDETNIITYRISDKNSVAVCVCEVGADETPSVQLGNLSHKHTQRHSSRLITHVFVFTQHSIILHLCWRLLVAIYVSLCRRVTEIGCE